jgi:hypothetical protein
MAISTDPIFIGSGDLSTNGTTGMATDLLTATGDYTGISANHVLVFTSATTEGSYIRRLRFQAKGTNVASVARIFINNGSTNATATNNSFYGQVTLPATTANSAGATVEVDYPLEFALNPAWRIYVGLGTTVAAGWVCTAIGGKYTALV